MTKTNDKFKLLTDAEHIRARFSMYGGSQVPQSESVFADGDFCDVVLVSGMLKIINEIIDNAIDEHVRTDGKFARKISVTVDPPTGEISVSDDGRGIPAKMIDTPDGKKWQMVTAFSHARAGSNFDDEDRKSIGMNGVGSMITFVTSSKFKAVSSDGKTEVTMMGERGVVKNVRHRPSKNRGTSVTFTPDLSFFGLTQFGDEHAKMIEERVKALSLSFAGKIQFKFNKRVIRTSFTDFFGPCETFKTDGDATFGITKSNGSFQTHSLVNGLSIKDGSHIDCFLAPVLDELRSLLKRRKKVEITNARLKQHMRVHCIINGFNALKFDSQTKERITNPWGDVKKAIGDYNARKIANKLMNDASLVDEIVAHVRMKEDLEAKRHLKGLEKKKKIVSDKYFAAVGDTKRIFLVEGDSAAGGLIKCLGRDGNAFYALKGVPLNVLEVTHQKFAANKELSELYNIVTTYPDAEICIATDADADGSRIRGLLCLFMFKYFADHYTSNKVRMLRTPIAIARDKRGAIKEWAYTFADVNALNSGLTIAYIKGLGSWSVDDLRQVIATDTLSTMLPYFSIDDATLFDKWFADASIDYRKNELLTSAPFDIMKV